MNEMKQKYTLRDVLALYVDRGSLPDGRQKFDNILSDSVYRVRLAFMSEDETHIETYPTHPILIPWYGCPVLAIDVDDNYVLRVWLAYEDWLPDQIERWKSAHAREDG